VTAPKRRTTRQQTELTAIAQIATTLQHQWHATEAVLAAQAAPTMRAAGSSNGGRGSDVPDPTYAIVATFEPHDELCEAIDAALVQMRWIQAYAQRLLKQHPDTAADADAIARALRCDGSVDPTCVRNAVTTGLCWACYQRKRRARIDKSNNDLLHMSLVEVGPSTVDATCGRCGKAFPASTQAEALELLAAHRDTEHGAA
jgi:hypothetical protein